MMHELHRKKRLRAFNAIVGVVAVMVVGFPATSLGSSEAVGASIEFLNPSSFADTGGAPGIIVSDASTTRPNAGTNTYRLSAWVANAPVDAGVEFELLAGAVSLDTFDAVREIGSDTFEYRWNIPESLPDGLYTLRSTLFSNNESIDSTDQDVTITRLADRAEVTYPNTDPDPGSFPGGGVWGTFRPLGLELVDGETDRPNPLGNVENRHTNGATQVRAFYTVSEPGTPPEWIACGTEDTQGAAIPSSGANNGIRCELEDPAHQLQISAVAAVANTSPGDYDPLANKAGDAVRVLNPYAQVPVSLSILEGDGETLEPSDGGDFECHTVVGKLTDQVGREVLGANVDVHATGPTDRLRFDRGTLVHSGLKAPDRGHTLQEPGYNCFSGSDTPAGTQGEHQRLGAPDLKHVESTAGTNDDGVWGFAFKVSDGQVSPDRYTVHFAMFIDELDDGCHANDDELTNGEVFRSGSVGLGLAPETAQAPELSALEVCTGPDPDPGDRVARTIDLNANKSEVQSGGRVTFSGEIQSEEESCETLQDVLLMKKKKSARRFNVIGAAKTNNSGTYEFKRVAVTRTRQYRTVAPATDECKRARSNIVTVTVTKN